MDRCPNCRARIDGDSHCRRCGLELEMLKRIEQTAQRKLRAGLLALVSGCLSVARVRIAEAQALKQQPLADALMGFIRAVDDDATAGCVSAATAPVEPAAEVPATKAQYLQW